MSNARVDSDTSSSADVGRALILLGSALAIIDGLDHPEIGARLQEVIDMLKGLLGRT